MANADCRAESKSIYEALASERRRATIKYLDEQDDDVFPLQLTEVAEHLVDELKPDTESRRRDRRTIYVSLYQHHAHVLSESDVVDYDRDDNVVAPGARFGVAVALIRLAESMQ